MDVRDFCEQIQNLIDILYRQDHDSLKFNPEDEHTIANLRQLLTTLKSNNVNQVLTCENTGSFAQFLADRWQMIKNTNLIYSHAPFGAANIICELLAKLLTSVHHKNYLQLLMPTLEVYQNEIPHMGIPGRDLEPEDFIVSDDNKRIIDVVACLDFAREDGILKHTSLFNGIQMRLSKDEATRIIDHSPLTKGYYERIYSRLKNRSLAPDLGTIAKKFIESIFLHERLKDNNDRMAWEYRKDSEILKNYEKLVMKDLTKSNQWLSALDQPQRELLFACKSPLLEGSWGDFMKRLVQLQNIDCPEYNEEVIDISNKMKDILEHNPQLSNIIPTNAAWLNMQEVELTESVDEKRDSLVSQLKQKKYAVLSAYDTNEGDAALGVFLGSYVEELHDLIFPLQYVAGEHYPELLLITCEFFVPYNENVLAYLLKHTPAEKRQALLDAHAKLQSIVAQVSKKLPKGDSFLEFHIGEMEPLKGALLIKLILSIRIKELSLRHLWRAILYFSKEERIDILRRFMPKLSVPLKLKPERLKNLLEELPFKDRIVFIGMLQHSLKYLIPDGCHLADIFRALPEYDHPKMMEYIRDSININKIFHHSWDVRHLYAEVAPVCRNDIYGMFIGQIFKLKYNDLELGVLFSELSPSHRSMLIQEIGKHKNKIIHTPEALSICFGYLTESEQAELIKALGTKLRDIIPDRANLTRIKTPLSKQNQQLCTSCWETACHSSAKGACGFFKSIITNRGRHTQQQVSSVAKNPYCS